MNTKCPMFCQAVISAFIPSSWRSYCFCLSVIFHFKDFHSIPMRLRKIQRGQRNSSLIERDYVYGAKASKAVHKREASLKVKYSPKRCISPMCLSWNLDSYKKSIMHQYGSPIHISQSGTWMSLSELRTGHISFSHSSLLALPPKRMISSDAWFIAW